MPVGDVAPTRPCAANQPGERRLRLRSPPNQTCRESAPFYGADSQPAHRRLRLRWAPNQPSRSPAPFHGVDSWAERRGAAAVVAPRTIGGLALPPCRCYKGGGGGRCGGAVWTATGSRDHVQGNSRRRRRAHRRSNAAAVLPRAPESESRGSRRPACRGLADRGGRIGGRTERRRGGPAPAGRRGVHGRAGRGGVDGLRAAVRGVPRGRAGRGGGAGPARGRLPERVGGADDERVVRVRPRRDAAGPRGLARHPGLPEPGRVHPRRERGPPRRRAADGRDGGHDRRRRGHRRGAAGRGRGRGAAAAADAVSQPGRRAAPGPGHRRAAAGPAPGRLAELAADSRRSRLQPPRPGDARQRRPAPAGLGAGDPRGQPPDGAPRARRGDVSWPVPGTWCRP